jgi:hypothetical protein
VGLAAYEEGIMSKATKAYSWGKAIAVPLNAGKEHRKRQALRNARGKGNATMMAQRFAKGLFKT